MNDQAQQHGITLVDVPEFVAMGLFAEVEMRRERVLEKVHDQVAGQYEKRGILAPECEAGREDFHQSRGQHEPCAESDEVFQVATLPSALHDDGAAKHIGERSSQAQQEARRDGIHQDLQA